MKDVNDLTSSIPADNTQPISLSAINPSMNKQNDNRVSINTTNGLTGVQDTPKKPERQVVKINVNRNKPTRRTVESGESVNVVDPEAIIEKAPAPEVKTPHDVAIDLLAEAAARKQEEYKQFVAAAEADDKINRERVEAGLESVGEEVQYMPNELHTPMAESDKANVMTSEEDQDNTVLDDPGNTETDDFDEDDAMDFDPDQEVEVPAGMTVSNTFYDEEEVVTATKDNIVVDEPVVSVEPVEEKVEVVESEDEEDIDKTIDASMSQGSFNMSKSALATDPTTEDFEMDESDFEDLTPDTEEIISEEEERKIYEAAEKNLKAEILQKIIKAGRTLNTTQFTVSTKVINVKDALKDSEKKVQRTATWPMMFAGRPFKASALKGPEIALLADTDDSDSNTSIGLTMDQARIMFEHDANPYRPTTLEAWAKTIPIYDVESIFAAMYIASLKDANYIPMACTKASCQYAYLTDDIDINNMVKFSNDESKAKFESIKNMELTPENTGSYESVLNVINDKFAIGLKIPSIFTMLYEYSSLTSEFVRKYSTMVSIIHYIDYIYMIDEDTQSFQPIGWKSYPGDNAKTFKSKIATYSKILKEFDDTDFSILMALINAMVNKSTDVKYLNYEIPATKCPKCGSEIPARPIFPRGMLFTRQRLVELATTPTEK